VDGGGREIGRRPKKVEGEAAQDYSLSWLKELGKEIGRGRSEAGGGSRMVGCIEELLKIRDKQGVLLPLSANKAQKQFEANAGRKNIILKARQMGISTWIAARFFLKTITTPGTLTLLVAHDAKSAEMLFRIVHRFWQHLPEALREGALRRSRANVRQMVFPELDSEYRVESAADAEAGRGATAQNLHASEVSRWPGDARATLAGLRAAVAPGGEIVLESTANGAGGVFYEEWKRSPEIGQERHFFPWWYEESYQADWRGGELTPDERELQMKQGLSDRQVAYRRELQGDFERLAAQEYAEDAETCFLASGECVFDVQRIETRLKECEVRSREDGVVEIVPVVPGKEYIIGVDGCEGKAGRDYACAQVVDRETGLQSAELHGRFSPRELGHRVLRLAQEYNQALVVVERNGVGLAVIETLLTERCPNLYGDRTGEGFLTTARTKSEIVYALANMLRHKPDAFGDGEVLKEMRAFVRKASGRCEANAGAHDDRVMALGIALCVRGKAAGLEMKPAS
jgi:hypothetical protein